MGSVSVSSCRCCMFVSCVLPMAVLNAAFCMTCSLLRGNNKILRTPPPHISSSEETSPPHSSHPCPTQNKQISLPQIIHTQSRHQITSITTMPFLQHTRHMPTLQLHPHMHHTVTPGFVDRPCWSEGVAGQMEKYAGWWTKNGMIGLPPQTRVKGVGGYNK